MAPGRLLWVVSYWAGSELTVEVHEDEEKAMEKFQEFAELSGAEYDELEQLGSMPTHKKGQAVKWSSEDDDAHVQLTTVYSIK